MGGRRVILVTARIEVPPPSRRELVQVLLHWAESVRRSEGALEAHVYEDLESATVVCLESHWSARPALGAHLGSQSFGSLLGAVELLATGSQVAVAEVAQGQAHQSIALRGLRDSIRVARGSTR